jgi:exopolyphosphatase / guanosine-5'-triphosphate,3'-diphosphate pyrophosphatase
MKCAAIDIGTNTILLLIAEKKDEALTDIVDMSTIVRLGEDLVRSGSLKKEAMSRTIDGLRNYLGIAASNDVDKTICVGTEALRKAKNGNEFVAQVKDIFGLDIEIISGRDEAYYTYLSICNDSLFTYSDMTIVDIGGGSTEIIDGINKRLAGYVSLPIGSVVLTDAYVSHDPALACELENVSSFIRKNLAGLRISKRGPLVGTAGTVTNIAALIL